MTINDLFKVATQAKASDLHLIVGKPPILRIDGELRMMPNTEILSRTEAEKLVFSIITEKQKKEFLENRELDISYEINGFSRYRINLFWEKDNVGLVARVISTDVPVLEDLGMPPIVHHLIEKDQGLILVTGPTGCGKSTTLAAMIQRINELRFANIITLEDPIEYIFKPVDRIIDVFPPHQQAQVRLQLSMSLSGVISQKLLPRVGGGRVAVREILINTPAIANIIRENKIPQMRSVIQTSADVGMFSMDFNIRELLEKNLIDEPTALAHLSTTQR